MGLWGCWSFTVLTYTRPRQPAHTHTRIDVFAVRQWPGNVADLEFRGMLAGCDAAIVAAAPIDGTLLQGDEEKSMAYPPANAAFLKSDEYKEVAKVLPFCRLWCVVEMAEVLALEKPLVFECGKVQVLARSRWSLQGDLKACGRCRGAPGAGKHKGCSLFGAFSNGR